MALITDDWDWLYDIDPIIAYYIRVNGYVAINDPDAIRTFCEDVIERNPKVAEVYKNGKTNIIGKLISQVMDRTNAGANATTTVQILKELLDG